MDDDIPTYAGPTNFRITVLKTRDGKSAVELHVPGFFTWQMDAERALRLATEMRHAAHEAIVFEGPKVD